MGRSSTVHYAYMYKTSDIMLIALGLLAMGILLLLISKFSWYDKILKNFISSEFEEFLNLLGKVFGYSLVIVGVFLFSTIL